MACVIVKKGSDVIIRVGTTASIDGEDIIIDGNIRLPDANEFEFYNDITIPDGVKAKTFCYNPIDGFFINKRFLYSSGEDQLSVNIPDVETTVNNPKVILADENTGDKTYNLDSIGRSLTIVNDGESSIDLNINSLAIRINAGESFSDLFNDFSSFTINTTSPYRLVVRG